MDGAGCEGERASGEGERAGVWMGRAARASGRRARASARECGWGGAGGLHRWGEESARASGMRMNVMVMAITLTGHCVKPENYDRRNEC